MVAPPCDFCQRTGCREVVCLCVSLVTDISSIFPWASAISVKWNLCWVWWIEPQAGDRGRTPDFRSAADLLCDVRQVPSPLSTPFIPCNGPGDDSASRSCCEDRGQGKKRERATCSSHGRCYSFLSCHGSPAAFPSAPCTVIVMGPITKAWLT